MLEEIFIFEELLKNQVVFPIDSLMVSDVKIILSCLNLVGAILGVRKQWNEYN